MSKIFKNSAGKIVLSTYLKEIDLSPSIHIIESRFDPVSGITFIQIKTTSGDFILDETRVTKIYKEDGVTTYTKETFRSEVLNFFVNAPDIAEYIPASEKGAANGVAELDANGLLPVSQLPSAAMTFMGFWNASTNTPTLSDSTGNNGDVWIISVSGEQDLGSGLTTFNAGLCLIHDGSIYIEKPNPVGNIATTDDLPEGTTNLYAKPLVKRSFMLAATSENAQNAPVTLTAGTTKLSKNWATASNIMPISGSLEGTIVLYWTGTSTSTDFQVKVKIGATDIIEPVLVDCFSSERHHCLVIQIDADVAANDQVDIIVTTLNSGTTDTKAYSTVRYKIE